MAFNNSHLGI